MASLIKDVPAVAVAEEVSNGYVPAGDRPDSEHRRPATTPGPGHLASAFPGHALSLATRSVHADDYINSHRAVAPPMHVSTTFRYSSDPDKLVVWENQDVCYPVTSRMRCLPASELSR